MKWISYPVLILIFFSNQAQAREWFELYNNSRTTAMGGVKIAVSSDDSTVFRNPSGLGSLRGSYINYLDPELETSSAFVNEFSNSGTELEKIKILLNTNRDKYYHAKTQITPSYSSRNFSVGLIYNNEVSAIMNTAGTALDAIYHSDIGLMLGYNYSFFDGRFKLGLTARYLDRVELDNAAIDPLTTIDLTNSGSSGTAFSGDLGLTLQAPVIYLPTLAVVVHDLADTKFTSSAARLKTATLPKDIKQSVDVGISLSPIQSKHLRSQFSVEYRDLTNSRTDDFINKRLHAGIEINWEDIFYLRLGSNQNYLTAGFEIAAERLSWQISTYGEEVGTKISPLEDRRFSTRIAVRF